MNKTKYLVIGAGTSSAAAIEALRKNDPSGTITVLTAEKTPFYSRPLITYFLSGALPYEKTRYLDDAQIRRLKINVRTAASVESLDPREKIVRGRGSAVKYEKLLIATGGEPVIPENLRKAKNLFTMTSLQDAQTAAAAIEKGARKAVVIGGGFIGLKTAEALRKRGLGVSLVELAPRVLPAILDEKSSAIFESNLKSHGIALHLAESVESVSADGHRLRLSSGKTIEADIIIAAIGVRPAISFIDPRRIKTDRGIIVDDFMRASAKDVWAAGDAAQAAGFFNHSKKRPIPIWPLAARQGAVAGENMSGGKIKYTGGIPMNSVEIFGLPVISAGDTAATAGRNCEIASNPEKRKYKKLVFEDERLVGYIMLGNIARAGIYTGLIKNRTPVEKFKPELVGDTFGFISVGEDTWKKRITPMEA